MVNRQFKIFGKYPMYETVGLVMSILGLMLLRNLIIIIIPVPFSFFMSVIGLMVVAFFVAMSRATKENHPSYVLSFISQTFLQPVKIRIENNREMLSFYQRKEKVNGKLKTKQGKLF